VPAVLLGLVKTASQEHCVLLALGPQPRIVLKTGSLLA